VLARTSKSGSETRSKGEPFRLWPQFLVGGLAVLILVAGGGSWAVTARLSGAVIAPGFLVVERNVKKVQHLDGGIVAGIAVKEGDRVAAGQVVLRLDNMLTKTELGVIETQLVELAGRKARLLAERNGEDNLRFEPGFDAMGATAPSVREGELRLFAESRKSRESQKSQLQMRVGQFGEEIVGLRLQIEAKEGELKLIGKELEQVRYLHEGKLTSVSRLYAMERELTKLNGEKGNLTAQVARAKGQISEINLQIVSIDQNARTEAQRELRSIEARMAELQERQAAARDRLKRTDLRAPLSGVVHELAVHTVGGVVTPASPIMTIVPDGERLSIEVRISPADIDQVAIGQAARVRFTAFNQRTTPEASTVVTRVAANVSQDPKSGASFYTGELEIDRSVEKTLGGLKLLPGMPVEVFIATSERTAFSYFVKPLTDQFARAFKEE
jgi:HlyD family type I secretion membrane fusion protein